MEKRKSYYVSLKNPLTWISALFMLGSAGLRIANIWGKGPDAATMWLLCILPVAAAIIFVLRILLTGREHFYKTWYAVVLMAIYFVAAIARKETADRYVFVNALVYLAFIIFYRLITAGNIRHPWLLPLMFAAAAAVFYYYRKEELPMEMLPDLFLLLGCLCACLAMHPHTDGAYHPTWGDRADGRLVRTLPGMAKMEPYIMPSRCGANNIIRDEVEITQIEKYILQKRKEGLAGFGINHVFIAAYVRCLSQFPACNRFCAGQKVYSRGDDIQYCMTVKKDMRTDSEDTCIKVHFKPTDTAKDVYDKMNAVLKEVKEAADDLDNSFEGTVSALTSLPSIVLALLVSLLRMIDYFGGLPKFLLEVSPFHGSVFFTSMGSLGIPAVTHHLYNFGNLPVFVAFGCKYRRNEVNADGTVEQKKYVDMTFDLDERICDGFYYAMVLKYLRRLLAHPERLDVPPETVVQDIP